MDIGPEIAWVWNQLDLFITTAVQNDLERVIERTSDIADRFLKAHVGLAEALYRRKPPATAFSAAAWHPSWRTDCVSV